MGEYENVNLAEVVCVDRISGAAVDFGDGGRTVYLMRLAGIRMGTGEQVPMAIYAMDVEDLGLLIARLVRTVTDAGEGAKLNQVVAAKMDLDPAAVTLLRGVVDSYFRRN